MLVLGFTPRTSGATARGYPNASRNRLRLSQGMTVSVVSKPAAMSRGLWARF